MVAQIIDGKLFSRKLRDQVAEHVNALKKENNVTPGLAVVLVGEDPASQDYKLYLFPISTLFGVIWR